MADAEKVPNQEDALQNIDGPATLPGTQAAPPSDEMEIDPNLDSDPESIGGRSMSVRPLRFFCTGLLYDG